MNKPMPWSDSQCLVETREPLSMFMETFHTIHFRQHFPNSLPTASSPVKSTSPTYPETHTPPIFLSTWPFRVLAVKHTLSSTERHQPSREDACWEGGGCGSPAQTVPSVKWQPAQSEGVGVGACGEAQVPDTACETQESYCHHQGGAEG